MTPPEFICPITHNIMSDPVICNDGHSYERSAISQWFARHQTSPMTNQVVSTDLISNISLRKMIQDSQSQPITPDIINVSVHSPSPEIKILKHNTTFCISCEDLEVRNDVHFVLAIDNSASMQESAGIQGDVETQCYSRLDLVKHATLCVVESLTSNDTIGIVVYSSYARILLQSTHMTPENKRTAKTLIENIKIEGATNLWDGLQTCLTMTQNISHPYQAVLLFTDGQPTAGNQQVDRAFTHYLNSNKKNKARVYTFGFSNEVNSCLLDNIAQRGNGQFHFISDSAMIFTIIVNFLSNYHTLYGDVNANGVKYGQLYYGQKKYIQIRDNVDQIQIDSCFGQNYTYHIQNSTDPLHVGVGLIKTQLMLQELIQLLKSRQFDFAKTIIDNFINDMIQYRASVNEDIMNTIIDNVADQVFLASTENYYYKWGKHYLYSFHNAVKNQINNNFKDSLVQTFGGKMFYKIQASLNEIVANISPPTPSRTLHGRTYTVTSMRSFNNSSNPCFAGTNKVKMGDNTYKFVKDVKFGDKVFTPLGEATVWLVVKTHCKDNLTELSKINNLLVTPWHPIYYDGTWTFPREIQPATLQQCDAVYSFWLDKYHIMNISSFDVISLAHGYTDNVIKHPFWGTHEVILALQSKPGYTDGFVELNAGCLKVNKTTGLVCNIT